MKADFDTLMHRYLDGSINDAGMQRLNVLLAADPGARRVFAELLNMDSALAALAAGWNAQISTPVPKPVRWRVVQRPWVAAAAGVALAVILWWWHAASGPHATVETTAGVIELTQGAALMAETRVINAGTLSLITRRGVRVVIEAPATFQFETAQRLRIMRGRVAADVPPAARGFTIITPSGVAVDLGTRFGVDVAASGDAEVHVFQGEVIATASGAKSKQNLRTGDAVAMTAGNNAVRDLRSAAFIQPDEVSDLTAGLAAGQKARSAAALAAWKKDPALIALLDFESPLDHPGTFRTVQGRWPGSRAPEFVNIGDHLKLDIGGARAWPELTLAAWVRLDRLGAPYQSLLHTDGWEVNKPGQVHWMVNRHATMRLALRENTLAPGSDELDGYPDSRTAVLAEQGRWMHLAVVYNSHAGTVRFYLNGRFDKETHQSIAHPARLGPAQIGNWNRTDRKLSGRVDEMIILGRAMTDAEIHDLFEAGNPYR